MFSQAVIEKLGFYVYFLKDPRNKQVFYIGKGKGNRVFDHLRGAIEVDAEIGPGMDTKLEMIREITGSGHDVLHYILRHGLDEKTAFEIEASIIDFLGIDSLSNIQGGYYSGDFGVRSTQEVIAMYEAAELATIEPILLLNLNKEYRRDLTPKELYEATRKWWTVGQRRESVQYAVAHYRGLTREVYRIRYWHEVEYKGRTRWVFVGDVAEDGIRGELLYKSVKHLFKKGEASPFKYLNC